MTSSFVKPSDNFFWKTLQLNWRKIAEEKEALSTGKEGGFVLLIFRPSISRTPKGMFLL
jgi:hypothetical protein